VVRNLTGSLTHQATDCGDYNDGEVTRRSSRDVSVCLCLLQTVIELKTADKHDTVQWYTLYHQQDDTVTASSSITSAASLEVRRLSALSLIRPVMYGKKGKGFPYWLPSVGPGSDPGVQAVNPQVTISHSPRGRLSLLSARPAATFPAAENHRLLAGTHSTVPRRVEG